MSATEPEPFELDADGVRIAGETVGEGPPIVALHGLTATRRYVVHGSRVLPRRGYGLVTYDARGHGRSGPARGASGYGYPELTADLGQVIDQRAVPPVGKTCEGPAT